MFAPLAFDTRALDHVPEVRYDTHLGEELAGFVEVNAPGIAAALGENFEHMPDGVITPDASVHPLPLGLGRVRATDVGRAEHPVATVEPAVRSPGERVQDLVRVGAVVPSIQQDLWSAAGPRVVPIADGDEHQVWRRANPNAAETDLQSADQVEVLQKHSAFVELVVPVGVLEDKYSVCPAKDIFELFGSGFAAIRAAGPVVGRRIPAATWIGVALGDPDPPAIIETEGDRLSHVRFARKDVHLEAGRQRRALRGLLRAEARERHHVGGRRLGIDLGRVQFVVELGSLRIEFEVIKINVAPMPALVVHDANEDFLSELLLQINDDRPQRFAFVTGDFEENRLRAGVHQFDARRRPRPARNQEAGPGLGDFERHGSQRALGIVADFFEAADPVIALVIAPHVVAAWEHRVALDGLAFERLACGLPILKRAVLEVEVERLAIFADGPEARRRGAEDGSDTED